MAAGNGLIVAGAEAGGHSHDAAFCYSDGEDSLTFDVYEGFKGAYPTGPAPVPVSTIERGTGAGCRCHPRPHQKGLRTDFRLRTLGYSTQVRSFNSPGITQVRSGTNPKSSTNDRERRILSPTFFHPSNWISHFHAPSRFRGLSCGGL